jgi:hypothetical protein
MITPPSRKPGPPPPPAAKPHPKAAPAPPAIRDTFVRSVATRFQKMLGPLHPEPTAPAWTTPVPPSWLTQRTRPPYIAPDTWKALPPSERSEIINDALRAWKAHEADLAPPAWLVEGSRPPFISEGTWNRIGMAERIATIADSRAAWQAYQQEALDLLFNGMPRVDGVIQEPYLVQHPLGDVYQLGFGSGVSGTWASYQGSANAAQYLDLRRLLGDGYPAAHYNLCGQLAVAQTLGLSVRDGLRLFSEMSNGQYNSVLTNARQTTGFGDLMAMFRAAGWTATYRNQGTHPRSLGTAADLEAALAGGNGVIALVNINGTGRLQSVSASDQDRDIAHWVTVMGVEQSPAGETQVRVYNPFTNHEEVYTWETFEAAWSQTAGNSSRHLIVVGTPPTP